MTRRTRVDRQPASPVTPARPAAERVETAAPAPIELDIGLYGSRATDDLAATWERWINSRWAGELEASVAAHPATDSPAKVPEPNAVEVLEPGQGSFAGGWAWDADPATIAEEAGRLPR